MREALLPEELEQRDWFERGDEPERLAGRQAAHRIKDRTHRRLMGRAERAYIEFQGSRL
jgi:hypothetical protein